MPLRFSLFLWFYLPKKGLGLHFAAPNHHTDLNVTPREKGIKFAFHFVSNLEPIFPRKFELSF